MGVGLALVGTKHSVEGEDRDNRWLDSPYQQGLQCLYLQLQWACWVWSACGPRAESDPVPLCPQTGPKETDDIRQQTTLPTYILTCHLYGSCWQHKTHLKCLKWTLPTAVSAYTLQLSIDNRDLRAHKLQMSYNYINLDGLTQASKHTDLLIYSILELGNKQYFGLI